MFCSLRHGAQHLQWSHLTSLPEGSRSASLTSAIGRGIRKSTGGIERLGTRRRRDLDDAGTDENRQSITQRSSDPQGRSRDSSRPACNFGREHDRIDRDTGRLQTSLNSESRTEQRASRHITPRPRFEATEYRTTRNPAPQSFTPRSRFDIERSDRAVIKTEAREQRDRLKWPAREVIETEAPLGVPYTTAGSEFVYGTFAVTAALEAKRRRLHKLYVWRGDLTAGDKYNHTISTLAKSRRVPIVHVAGQWDKMLMRMSGQRPHNGYVLEASPVPKLPIMSFLPMKGPTDPVVVQVGPQTLEDQAVNKTFKADSAEATIPRTVARRYPLFLWLDRITDTGNIGAIIRTAYFFGIDGILIPEHGTAPLNPIAIKASAGAAEYVPILTVKREVDFIRACQSNGWRFFAAVPPESVSTRKNQSTNNDPADESGALDQAPSVLMVGNEGEGLRAFLQEAADAAVSIRGVRSSGNAVDSLNVSVAAALLTARFMTPPMSSSQPAIGTMAKSDKVEPSPIESAVF